MPAVTYSPDEIIQRGEDRYQREIRDSVEGEAQNLGKILALDVDSGEYAIADDSLTAFEGLKSRKPEASIYIVRVGYPTAVKIGVGRRAAPRPNEP